MGSCDVIASEHVLMKKWVVVTGLVVLAIWMPFQIVNQLSRSHWIGFTVRVRPGSPDMFLNALVTVQGIILILWGLIAKEGRNTQLSRKKVLLLIAPIIVAAVLDQYFLVMNQLGASSSGARFERSIVRKTRNSGEEAALATAESFDYPEIFGLTRFTGGTGHLKQDLQGEDGWPFAIYTWANFIDTQVIEYYDDRFESLNETSQGIEFSYHATVMQCGQIRVIYIPPPRNGNTHDDALQVLGSNGSILFRNSKYSGPSWGMRFACQNDSRYQEISAKEINFTVSRGYIVEMSLRYREYYGPLAAFGSIVYQIIVVDEDSIPLLLCVQSAHRVS